MYHNRNELKLNARQVLRENGFKLIWAGFIFIGLKYLLQIFICKFTGYTDFAVDLLNASAAGKDLYTVVWPQVESVGLILAAVLGVMTVFVKAGFDGYILTKSRRGEATVRDIFNSFNHTSRLFLITVFRAAAIGFGLVLFVVPGITLYYRFRLAVLVMYDHPEMNAAACLLESARLMKGRCMELFILDISFIGWFMLSEFFAMFSLPLVNIWIAPYRLLTVAGFYNGMCGEIQYETKKDPEDHWFDNSK